MTGKQTAPKPEHGYRNFFSFLSRRHTELSTKPVLAHLLFPLVTVVIVLAGGGGILFWMHHRATLEGKTSSYVNTVKTEFHMALDEQASGLTGTLQFFVDNNGLRAALRSGDRNRLLSDWKPVFEKLNRRISLSHLYFMDRHRRCILRVHKPDAAGDIIDRFTAIEAERTGGISSGIELGPLGTFTLRVVQPVFEGSELIGYVELGKEIEDVLQTLQKFYYDQWLIMIDKKYLNRRGWESGMKMLGREATWDRLKNNAITYSSQGDLPGSLASWADTAHEGSNLEYTSGGKSWQAAAACLKDASGREVGHLLVIRDITAEKRAFTRSVLLAGFAGTLLFALFLAVIYVLLRRTDSWITAQQKALKDSEESYRNQFAYNQAVMLLIDPVDGAIVDANIAAVKFYGYPVEKLLSLRLTDINTLSDNEVFEAMASVPAWNGKRFNFRHRLADGSARDVEVSSTPIQFGKSVVLHSIIHDITDRKRAEQELKDSNAYNARILKFNRALLSAIPTPVFYEDRDGRYLGCNPAFTELIGVSEDDIRGKMAQEVWPARHSDVYRQKDAEMLMNPGRQVYESTVVDRNGQERTVIFAKDVFHDEQGNVAGIVGSFQDITDYRTAEDGMNTALSLLNAALEATADGILIVGSGDERTVTGYNRKFLELWRIPPRMAEDARDDELLQFVIGQIKDPGAFMERVDFLYLEPEKQSFDVIELSDGRMFERFSQPQRIGEKIIGRVWSFRDVSDRKKVLEALSESEEKFRLLFERSVDPILLIDNNRWAECNAAALQIMGCVNKDQLLGLHPSDISPELQPDGLPSLEKANEILRKAMVNGSDYFEWVHRDVDGNDFWVDVSLTVIPIRGKRIFYTVWRDITARKRAEKKINDTLKEKDALLKEIQHRVKNSLLTISGILALQRDQAENDEVKDAIITSLNRLTAMTKIHSRLYRSDDYSSIDFGEYIREMIPEICRSYGFPARNIELDTDAVSIEIHAAIPAGLIVNELASNAMKHAFPGGQFGTIRVCLKKSGAGTRLTIEDDGIGLPRDVNIHEAQSLGMQFISGLLLQLDADIRVERDTGTRFTVDFRVEPVQ